MGFRCTYARVEVYVDGKLYGMPIRHYAGERLWRCNPGIPICGNFHIEEVPRDRGYDGLDILSAHRGHHRVHLTVHASVIDGVDYDHPLLPLDWYYDIERERWVLDP